MHELSIAQNILEAVNEQLEEVEYQRVVSIKVKIGELSAVDPSSLDFSFNVLVSETPFQNVKLEIEEIPLIALCHACKKESKIENYFFICGNCGSTNIKILSGDELTLSEIEYE